MNEPRECRITQEFHCYYDLYVPDGATPKPLLIALHGYGGDKTSMMRLARRINENDFVIAALQGPHQHMNIPKTPEEKFSIGFGWLTNFKAEESVAFHHHNIRQIITSLTADGIADPHNIFLMGFSQAVGVNFRFAFTHANLLRGVIGLYGGIPGDWQTEGKYTGENLDILYVGGEQDEYYSSATLMKNAEALRQRARSVNLEIFGNGHEVAREAHTIINQWLLEKVSNQ